MVTMNPKETALAVTLNEIHNAIIENEDRPDDSWTDEENAEYRAALREIGDQLPVTLSAVEDTKSVQEACSDFGNEEGPRGIRQLYARFEDRIRRLS